ncbi:MAG: nucleoside transporter C-terminal domain-containing protein [Bacteroidota bacterium]|nr:nucleoside transporter C-terminal domain-containing protein [Bacteroidota bacterium]
MKKTLLLLVVMLIGIMPNNYAFAHNVENGNQLKQVVESVDTQAVNVQIEQDENVVKEVVTTSAEMEFSFVGLLRGLLGIIVIIGIAWVFSSNRKAISWRVVLIGLSAQILLAVGVLYVPFVQAFFDMIGKIFVKILDFTDAGTMFLFKSFVSGEIDPPLLTFAITILPTIIFFSALTSVLFYLGIIQKVVFGLAWVMQKFMRLSGAESLSVAGNIFLGQTESPLMIKSYLDKMTKSEMLLVMSGGMATLAGGVLAVYISVLGNGDPVQELLYAKHLLAASIMAAPGVIVISKILVPQTEEVIHDAEISKDDAGKNVLDAISNGTSQGLKLAVNVAAMLLVFIAMIAMVNYIFLKIGDVTSLNAVISDFSNGQYSELSLQFIMGYALAPLMWLLGVDVADITLVGQIVGEKIIMTEFIGYISLDDLKEAGAFAEQKSIIMATYMLCGFANFASIGIQIGGIGSLAPNKRVLLSQFGMKALLAGTLASLLSASIIGVLWM